MHRDLSPARRRGLLASTVLAGASVLGLGAVAIVAAALPAGAAYAQDYTSGTLTGTVEDDAGAPVAGARVTVTSPQGAVRETQTDADGAFRVPALAVGGYTVRVEHEGYSAAEDRDVAVEPGGASYAFTLSAGAVEEVVVTGSRRTRDFNRTDTGLSVNVQVTAERVPVGRTIGSIIQLAPGTGLADASISANGVRRDQSVSTLSGASAAESVYYINGLNVTDQRTFLGFADLPFDAIQTIDVKTGGYSAEFGRATGGVLNIVTRSGSNSFEGGAGVFFTPNALRADRSEAFQPGSTGIPGQVVYNQFAESSLTEGSLWLSGPIIKDRLFFFALVNPRERETWNAAVSTTSTGPGRTAGTQTRTSSDDPRYFAKVDFNLTDEHRLEATLFSDRADTRYEPYNWTLAGGRGTPLLGYVEQAGGLNQIYKYTGVLSEAVTVSALYGEVQSIYKDVGPATSVPRIRDLVLGTRIGSGLGGGYDHEGEDTRKTYRFDVDLYAQFMGDHHFRLGYDREDLTSVALNGYSGGGDYVIDRDDLDGDGDEEDFVNIVVFNNDGTFTAEQSAFYAQDSWTVNDRLTLQAGVRLDRYNYKNIDGETYIDIDNQFAPRLGFSFDPSGDRSSRFYGSFGHYYLPIATNTSIRASSGEDFYIDTFAVSRNAAGQVVLGADGRPVLGAELAPREYLSPPTAPDVRQVVEQDLKPMYEREIVLGYERDVADWTFGLRYIDRELASAIEDTAIGDAVLRFCARTGRTDCTGASGDYPYVLINPGDGARVFVDPDLGGPVAAQFFDLTAADLALPEVDRRYRALEFTFARPFDGRWGVQGSYTYSKSEGNYEGAVKSDVGQTDTSITQDFDHDYNTIGAAGRLPNDRPHQLKVFGTYAVLPELRIGASVRAESGRPYGCLGYAPNPSHASGTPSAWYCPDANGVRQPTPRGSRGRTDAQAQLDLRLDYTRPLPGRLGELRASIDVFNVFDNDAVTRVVEQGEVTSRKGTAAPFYGLARTYQAPRTVRFGLQYQF